ncbi:MAG TPA: RNA pyrophosphohydrolase [Xanthobacteraceae bacterium]
MTENRRTRHEPNLEDMLADPIVWMVMKSDRVDEQELRSLLARVAADLTSGGADPLADSDSAADTSGNYRCGVGIMLLNTYGQVFVGKRTDTEGDAWQMPQGGVDAREEPRAAALRELKEEIGTNNAQIIAESKVWLRYKLPSELRKRWDGRWRGQEQKWFVMRFQGTDADVNVASDHPEFSAWKWVSVEELPGLIVSFKRQLYLDLLAELREAGTIPSANLLRRPDDK